MQLTSLSAPITLDITTLFVIATCITALLGLLLLSAWSQERVKALAWWGSAYLIGGFSVALWSVEGSISPPLPVGAANTLVFVATEFGRTAAPNGTGGTDHGTASLAMLFGGAVAGGRVIADWPGLSQAALHEGRDLRPTLALDTLIASAVAQHYRLDMARTAPAIFPSIAATRGVEGLIRA